MWHRLSVHVKRQEAGSNQMAVIKPLTNTYQNRLEFSNLSTKTLYNVAEEDEGESVRYNPPATPPRMAHEPFPARALLKDAIEEVELYTPERLRPNTQQATPDCLQGRIAVSFRSEVPELSDRIGVPETMSMPAYHQAHLIQQDSVLPVHLHPYSQEHTSPLQEELENEHFGILQGYMYNNNLIHHEEDSAEARSVIEDSLALMPPSPFRDCTCSPASPFSNSPMSESILCGPPNVTYASVILGDFKQSSSTL